MSDPVLTRVETVEAHIAAVKAKHGPEAYWQILAVCAEDISMSLAMLVDAGSTETTETTETTEETTSDDT